MGAANTAANNSSNGIGTSTNVYINLDTNTLPNLGYGGLNLPTSTADIVAHEVAGHADQNDRGASPLTRDNDYNLTRENDAVRIENEYRLSAREPIRAGYRYDGVIDDR